MERSNKKGFTLVEILVVLVIIGILVALILPNTLKAIDSGNIKKAAGDLRNIDTALHLCYSQNLTWTKCDTIALLNAGGYSDNIGNNPWGSAYALAGSDTAGWTSDKSINFSKWPVLTPVTEI